MNQAGDWNREDGASRAAAREVAGRYRVARGMATLESLGNRGGLSGANLWRVRGEHGEFCLKRWPAT